VKCLHIIRVSLMPYMTAPRTREGYYHYTGGVEAAIKRALAFAPHADLIWLETKLPDLEQARYFARKIRAKYPGKLVFLKSELLYLLLIISSDTRWFVYNLSPSFNWSGHGFTGMTFISIEQV
jgi:isocitrate lyase